MIAKSHCASLSAKGVVVLGANSPTCNQATCIKTTEETRAAEQQPMLKQMKLSARREDMCEGLLWKSGMDGTSVANAPLCNKKIQQLEDFGLVS